MERSTRAKSFSRVILVPIATYIGLASPEFAATGVALGAPQLDLSVSAPASAPPDSNVMIEISRANTERGLGGLAYDVILSQSLHMVAREYSDFGWIANDGFFDNGDPKDSGAVSADFQAFTFDTVAAGPAGAEFPPDSSGLVERFTIRTPPAGTIPPQGLTITVDLSDVSASDGAGADWTTSLGGTISVATDSNGHAASLLVVAFSDCNSNGVFDGDDIAAGTSLDCNGDNQPDECEADCDGNGVPDDCDIAADSGADCNTNGMVDQCELAAAHNCCAFDHGAGCLDPVIESCVCAIDSYCCDVEWDRLCALRVEEDGCGSCDFATDCNSDGVLDECQPDFDGDGVTDDCDDDVDGDSVPNASDPCLSPPGIPTNISGGPQGDFDDDCTITLADYAPFANCLTAGGPMGAPDANCLDTTDFDQDGDIDLADVSAFQSAIALICIDDCMPDSCHPDFDQDGITDDCDSDIDGDGVPNASDPCPSPVSQSTNAFGGPLGDFDDDCAVTLADFPSFESCLSTGGPTGLPGSDCLDRSDFDQDGDIDLNDVAALQSAIAHQP